MKNYFYWTIVGLLLLCNAIQFIFAYNHNKELENEGKIAQERYSFRRSNSEELMLRQFEFENRTISKKMVLYDQHSYPFSVSRILNSEDKFVIVFPNGSCKGCYDLGNLDSLCSGVDANSLLAICSLNDYNGFMQHFMENNIRIPLYSIKDDDMNALDVNSIPCVFKLNGRDFRINHFMYFQKGNMDLLLKYFDVVGKSVAEK